MNQGFFCCCRRRSCCCQRRPARKCATVHPSPDIEVIDDDVLSGEQSFACCGCIQGEPHHPSFQASDMGWDLTPSSLAKAISWVWRRYRLPVLITESGCADGGIPDTRRVRYLAGCLRGVNAVMHLEGADVRGYTYWSFTDNFEWAEGFRPRFGLFRVDYKSQTLDRSDTGASGLYAAIISQHQAACKCT